MCDVEWSVSTHRQTHGSSSCCGARCNGFPNRRAPGWTYSPVSRQPFGSKSNVHLACDTLIQAITALSRLLGEPLVKTILLVTVF
jgi:hypothetical protein